MPRFLHTSTGDFEWIPDPSKVPYAVLSHVWRSPLKGGEQSYDDIRALQAVVAAELRRQKVAVLDELRNLRSLKPSHIPRTATLHGVGHTRPSILTHPQLSDKVKGLCKVAREAGFQFVWNDACCIDKSSSAELSEAINSMYDWYRLSDMCFVYLEDVPEGDNPRVRDSSFRRSAWHTRGWTLQELIAPEHVDFLTQGWRFLGTKIALARTLEEITGVDVDILVGRSAVPSVSVARRMHWAARRRTTRIEDKAYSLMGIFGVHMSPIYGEGKNAFLRLQEEIIRTIPDQSVFVWGYQSGILMSLNRFELEINLRHAPFEPSLGLLASAPSEFRSDVNIKSVPPSQFASRLRIAEADVPPLHCIFTPQGVRIQLLCLPLARVPEVVEALRRGSAVLTGGACDDCVALGPGNLLALLQCEDDNKFLIALPLHRTLTAATDGACLVGTHRPCPRGWHCEVFHAVRLHKTALEAALDRVRPVPVEVSILRHYSRPPVPKSHRGVHDRPIVHLWPDDPSDNARFDIAPRSISTMRTLGFVASPLQVTRTDRRITLETILACRDSDPDPEALSGKLGQTLELRVCLVEVRVRWLNSKITYSVDTSISVTNRFAAYSHESLSMTPDSAASALRPHSPGYGTTGTPSVNANGSHSMCSVQFEPKDTTKSTFVSAEFVVPLGVERADTARFLRIALGRPLRMRAEVLPQDTDVWMFIDISEEYEYTPIEGGLDHTWSESAQTGRGGTPETSHYVRSGSSYHPSAKEDESTGAAPSQTDEDSASGTPYEVVAQTPMYVPSAVGLSTLTPSPPDSCERSPPLRETCPLPISPSFGEDMCDHADGSAEPYASQESVRALRRENHALRAQISAIASQNASIVTQNAALSSQMSAVTERLDALKSSTGK